MSYTQSTAIAIAMADAAMVLAARSLLVGPFRRLRQPPVIAEIVAGISLGPSLLGLLPGNLPQRLFPTEVRPLLSAIAEVGLLLFMFLVGWELEAQRIWSSRVAATSVSLTSMALPFGGGVLLAGWLYTRHSVVGAHHVSRISFVLFIGVAMSITAFPVLARIIVEHRMQSSPIGLLALASAAVGDLISWCLLALVSAIVTSKGSMSVLRVIALSMAYLAVLALIVRPILRLLLARISVDGGNGSGLLSLVTAGIFLSAYATNWIGLDAIFGAFAFGAVMPKGDSRHLQAYLKQPSESITGLLMPIFFVVTGLSIDVTKLGSSGWLDLAAVLTVACAGKFIGSMLPARLCRMPWRDSMTLGLLMNTRGLTELVILNIGRSLGVLDTRMFTIMVLMALITTSMAGPLLPKRVRQAASADAADKWQTEPAAA